MICNPAYYAFKSGLEAFHKNPSNEVIDDLHTILLLDGSQRHTQILKLIPQLYPYIGRKGLYDKLCLLFSDVAHLNQTIQNSLMDFEIFKQLDYNNEITYCLVVSICDCNTQAWTVFT